MDVDLIPTLIDQYRETFEGEVSPGRCWITDGPPESAVLGTLDALSAAQAFTPPTPGGRSIAAHVQHLRYTLDLTLRRLHGENPATDWPGSFALPSDASNAAAQSELWSTLRRDLRTAYDGVLAFVQQHRGTPTEKWPPIHLAGLCAMTAHNAYHLGAIRQIAKLVRPK